MSKNKKKDKQVEEELYSPSEFEFQSSVSGEFLHIVDSAVPVNPVIRNTFDLRLGVSVSMDHESGNLSIVYGDTPPVGRGNDVPPPVNRKVDLFGTLASVQYNQRNASLDLTGIGTIDLITTDPVDFTFVSAPFRKVFNWDSKTRNPVLYPIKPENVVLIIIDHVHLQFIEGDNPFWNVTVYFKKVANA